MRHEHEFGLALADEFLERRGKAVGRVTGELFALDGVHLGEFLGRDLTGDGADVVADDGSLDRPAGLRGEGLRSGERLPGNAVQFAFTLFDDDQNRIHLSPQLLLPGRPGSPRYRFPQGLGVHSPAGDNR